MVYSSACYTSYRFHSFEPITTSSATNVFGHNCCRDTESTWVSPNVNMCFMACTLLIREVHYRNLPEFVSHEGLYTQHSRVRHRIFTRFLLHGCNYNQAFLHRGSGDEVVWYCIMVLSFPSLVGLASSVNLINLDRDILVIICFLA